jgi:chaperonin cofactor prefoldin
MKMSQKKLKTVVEDMASQFVALDTERQRIEREARQLKKKLDELKEVIQEIVGVAEEMEVPFVSRVGNYYITQIKKHRDVDAYSYDFIEFKIMNVQ